MRTKPLDTNTRALFVQKALAIIADGGQYTTAAGGIGIAFCPAPEGKVVGTRCERTKDNPDQIAVTFEYNTNEAQYTLFFDERTGDLVNEHYTETRLD